MTGAKKPEFLPIVTGVLVLALLGTGYEWKTTYDAFQSASEELTSTKKALENARDENQTLSDAFDAERSRNDAFEGQLSDISGTVGKLDKLAKTDPELLQKYSKVFFLNENYIPSALIQIPEEWTYGGREEYFHKEVWRHLRKLLEDAADDGINLRVLSAYRAFEKQAQLKSAYTVQYGSGANTFSADQGYSEHQLGTTLDFTTKELGGLTNFETTEAFTWLTKNAYKYGFTLSYPKGNTFYVYEPWHWRFVGTELANDLHDDSKNFYDLDQRTIDEYLIDFFD